MQIKNYNNDFLIIKSENDLQAIGKAIFQSNFDFVEEVIVAETEICIKLNSLFTTERLQQLENLKISTQTTIRIHELPVHFTNHEDWKTIEQTTNLTKSEIIEKLINTDFKIAMFGFLPGFLYLDGLDEILHMPRKAVPSKRVEANSLAIGGKYLGVYSIESPGGWYVIGKVEQTILDRSKIPPLEMNLGDVVRLKVA